MLPVTQMITLQPYIVIWTVTIGRSRGAQGASVPQTTPTKCCLLISHHGKGLKGYRGTDK